MTALQAAVIILDDAGEGGPTQTISIMDVIEFDGQVWLVPEWLDIPDEKVTMPVRIVLLDVIPHERGTASPQIVVSGPVPKSVFEGRIPPELESQYVVIERPDIRLPLPSATH